MKAKRTLIAVNALLAGILACNMPSAGQNPQQQPQQPDLAGTITAQALVLNQQQVGTPVPATQAFTEVPSLTPTVTLTPTPSVPQVSVSSATNCRTGPGTEYDLIFTMQPGQTAELIGKNTPTAYWIIKMPGGGYCWLWGQYAATTGNTSNLPEYPVPPTPTPSVPANPSGLKVGIACVFTKSGSGPLFFFYNKVHAEITWVDNATNEDGYYVWRDSTLIGTLSPNTTGIEDNTTLSALYEAGNPPTVTYTVQAFNAAGSSKKISKTLGCP